MNDRFPKGIPFIVGNEGAERFSFYGMRAILYVYLTSLFLGFVDQQLASPELVAGAKAHATEVTHLFMAGVYAFPIVGAILADRLAGKYRVIFWVSLIYVAGHAVLAVAGRAGSVGSLSAAELGMYLGLGLIAVGSGGIKPCVSANVGDQFSAENAHLVPKVFQIFYFIINFGSFFATLLIPLIKARFGAEVAFGVPGVLMAIAAVVFWIGNKRYVKVPPKPGGAVGALDVAVAVLLFVPFAAFAFFGVVPKIAEHLTGAEYAGAKALSSFVVGLAWPYALVSAIALVVGILLFALRQKAREDDGFLAVLLYAFVHRKERAPGTGFFELARQKYGEEAAEGPPAVLRIVLVFSMVSVFWALFDQHSSTWIEQAGRMDLGLNVPYWVGVYAMGATIALALFGLTVLLLWVSNIPVPRMLVVGVLVLVGLIGVGFGVVQLQSGRWYQLTLQASQLAALNPLMVMMIIPLLNFGLWRPLEKRGIVVKPLQKMTAGMFAAAAAFAIAGLLQVKIQGSADKLPVLWQVGQYLVITTAEVLVSITGLEFAYTQAPRRMKSTIMGFWLLCVTAGNLIVAFLAPLQKAFPLSTFFFVFAGLMTAASTLFALMAYLYKGKSYLQQAAPH
ncbi:MAG: POT-type proton-dependent oligopeptide transporter [Myxococcaceae bacterium]